MFHHLHLSKIMAPTTCNCTNMGITIFSLSFIFLPFLSHLCSAIDTITPGQTLQVGQIIVSPNQTFALGFFTPDFSTNHYLGIWFHNVSVQTVVWIANRENPLIDSSGVLKFDQNGNLVILDGNNNTIWSTNITISVKESTAKLSESGNLVLIGGNVSDENSRKVLWESFNFPTDTFLPGMKFGLNLRTGEKQLLKPWKGPNDPSSGNFSLGFDTRGLAQIVIWKGSQRYWRSGLWNGQGFIGVPEMSSFYLYGFNVLTDDDGKMYCTYVNVDDNVSEFSRFVLDQSGQLQRSYWLYNDNHWAMVWSQPKNDSEIYNICGTNGILKKNSSTLCSCLFGFEPKYPKEWDFRNWSGGCVRRTQLQCGKNNGNSSEGLLKLSGMKLPDNSNWFGVDKSSVCMENCMQNCSCVAMTYETGLGCLYWNGDLVDLEIFPRGGQDLYIKLAQSEIDNYYLPNAGRKRNKLLVIIVVLVVLGTIVLIIYAYLMWRRISALRARLKRNRDIQEQALMDLGGQIDVSPGTLDVHKLKESVHKGKRLESPLFDLDTILASTNNFSSDNKLGEGGFGPVYKGRLPNGQEIAIKRLSRGSGQGLVEFENEVVLIAKLQHRNLVRLLGYCIQGEEKLLIYEYMPNKSLDAFLFDPIKRAHLDWRKRFHIIEGIARGLLYLHRDSRLTIIHRDLKASNILLDEEMNPKISDFGMARIFGDDQEEANTNRVVGTYGYMSPEYAMEGLFSEKSDVYSFGVLLLEVMSGKKNTGFFSSGLSINLLGYAWQLWQDNNALKVMDPSLTELFPERDAFRCINIGLLCVQEGADDRPTMSSVVLMLGNETANLPSPKQPAFSIGRSCREMTRSSTGNYSMNDLTLSVVHGR